MSCDTDPVVVEIKLSVTQGEDRAIPFFVVDAAGAVDLTGATVYFTVRKKAGDSNLPLIYKTSALPAEILITVPQATQANKDRATIFLLPADTNPLPPADYVFDVWVKLASGKKRQAIPTSKFTVANGVTIVP